MDRVLADNPETDGQADSDMGAVEPSTWRLLRLRMPEGDGGELRATIARPVWEQQGATRSNKDRHCLEFNPHALQTLSD